MLDWIKTSAESFALAWPNLVISCFTIAGAMTGLWGGWSTIKSLKDAKGTVSGKIITEDGSDPSLARLSFLLSQGVVATAEPDKTGNFSVDLEHGNYSLQVVAPGYNENVIDPVIVSKGTYPINATLTVTQKPVTLVITDKQGIPYAGLNMAFEKSPRDGNSLKITSDKNGQVQIPSIAFGRYNLILADPTNDPDIFLWAHSGSTFTGSFQLKAHQNIYSVILPRVIYHDLFRPNSASTLVPTNERFYAQAFTLSSSTKFCGVGFGFGLGGNGTPTTIQVREDTSGHPGAIIFQQTPVPFTGAISIGTEAGYAFCDPASPVTLPPGTYWVVAQYDSIPKAISILGGNRLPKNGSLPLSSADGVTWATASLVSDWKMINFFLVE